MLSIKEILREVYPVSDEAAALLTSLAVVQTFNKRDRLVEQGKRCHHVYFIRSGICRSMYEGDDKEDTRWFATGGDVVTSVTSWHTNAPAIFSIEALTDMECFVIPYCKMRQIVNNNREIHAWAFKLLAEQLYVLERRYVIIGTGDAASRYASLMRGRPQSMMRRIPLKYIAQYLDMTQETLSRVRHAYARGKGKGSDDTLYEEGPKGP